MNAEVDRLSTLPDDLIHKILLFVDMRDAIRISGLSSRWRFIWTSMPYLNFSIGDFPPTPKFSKFATDVLSRRDNLTQVYSLKLSCSALDNDIKFPRSLFISQSLKLLSLKMQFHNQRILTSTWELPELTTLELHGVNLSVDVDGKCLDIFSKFANLKNLTLNDVSTNRSNSFSIIHPRLSSLTLEDCWLYSMKEFNVVAPQLKNLTIRWCPKKLAISAPELTSLVYQGSDPLAISTEGFHSLEKADICIFHPGGRSNNNDALPLISLLQLVHNVQFLTLNLRTVEFLSSFADLILPQPSPFVNIKSLKIYPQYFHHSEQAPDEVTTLSPKLKSYLLDSSPGSTFTMVLRKSPSGNKNGDGAGPSRSKDPTDRQGIGATKREGVKKRAELTEEIIQQRIEERALARQNREFKLGDQIRSDLFSKRIALMDVGSETIWRPCVPTEPAKSSDGQPAEPASSSNGQQAGPSRSADVTKP